VRPKVLCLNSEIDVLLGDDCAVKVVGDCGSCSSNVERLETVDDAEDDDKVDSLLVAAEH
jgi:hypothetical protein